MKPHSLKILLASSALCLVLAACSTTTQTTSGGDYLGRYSNEMRAAGARPNFDMGVNGRVHDAAAVEPSLHFPARIGLARLAPPANSYGRAELSGIPEAEAKAWSEAATRLGPSFGEFVPISPLVAEMLAPNVQPYSNTSVRDTIEKIRLGAARQHVDAVIIYESEGTANSKSNPLSLGEWTLIGAFILPSQNVKAQGIAQAILIDVRNGYPYGTARTSADDETLSARFSTHEAERDLGEAARLSAVEKLPKEVEQMMRQLRTELAEKRERRAAR
jgi:hypothetical protein